MKFAFFIKLWYYNFASKPDNRCCFAGEESPSFIRQGARQLLVEVTPRKVQQRYTAKGSFIAILVRVERRGKSSPAQWQLCGYVNPI